MKLISKRGARTPKTPVVVTMRRLDDVLYGIGLLGIGAVISCAERLIDTHIGAAVLALMLLGSGAAIHLARWLDKEVTRHER